MILKKIDNKAEQIALLQGLLDARPPKLIADKIQFDLDSMIKGFQGEKEVAHWLNRRYSNSDLYAVIHDLHFAFDDVRVQFDHIVIHRHMCLIYVFETKNAPGGIRQEKNGQWSAGASVKPIPSPLVQAKSGAETLRRWLDRAYPGLIVEVRPVLVVTQATKIDADPETYIRSDGFEDYAEQVFNDWPLFEILYRVGRCKLKGFNQQKLIEMGQALVKGHRPLAINPVTTYGWRPPIQSAQVGSPESRAGSSADLEIGSGVILKRNHRGFAIRHDETLIGSEVIDEIGRRHGEWNERWKNWIVPSEAASHVADAIRRMIS